MNKSKQVIFYSFIFVLSISCVPMKVANKAKGDLDFEETPKRSPAGGKVAKLSLGKKIWTNSCSNCHTNKSTGLPNKLYSTKTDIQNGLDNVQNMAYLKSFMSEEYIDAVFNYLNVEAPKEASGNSRPPVVVAKISLGKKIWTNSCASCHTNQSHGFPNKLYSTKTDIQNALDNIKNMAYLRSMMTAQYVDAVYSYLNIEAIKEIQERKSSSIVTHKSTLGTNRFMASKLKEIYTSSPASTSVSTLNSIITAIETRPGSFGGTCAYGYDSCSGESTENNNAPMNISMNVVRRGVIIKVCRELHSKSAAVRNVLAYCSINSSAGVTDATLLKVINAYSPGRSDDNGIFISQLKGIYSKAIANGLSSEAAWNMVLYSICRSTIIEKI